MKKKIVLVILFLAAIAASVSAIPSPPSCDILEKPTNISVSCSASYLLVDDNIQNIQFLETPFGEVSKEMYEQVWKQKEIFEKNLGTKESVVPFPTTLPNIPPKEGIYVIRLNNEYDLKISYGANYLVENYFNLALLIGGPVLLALGVVLKTKNKKEPGAILILLGMIVIFLTIIKLLLV